VRGKLAAGIVLIALAWTGGMIAPSASQARTTPIRHVVILYLENHSFDNLFGFWCDSHHRRCPDGGMPSSVTLSSGAVVKPSDDPDVPPVVKHTVASQVAAINGGKMNGWQHINGCHGPDYRCISGYRPGKMPNMIALATRFALSDHTFSMGDSPSWGGHLYVAMASLDGFLGDTPQPDKKLHLHGPGWGCNSGRLALWQPPGGGRVRKVPACVPDPALQIANGGAFRPTPVKHAPTIMDRLSAAGLSWRIYGATLHSQGYYWSICPSLADCLDTSQVHNLVPDGRFFTDAAKGNLPSFSIITPGGKYVGDSEHNGFSMTAGDDWLGQIASAVMKSSQWRSTVLFITWDDCGCFYDQVPPGINPDGTQQGPRAPLVIVSPYAKPGYTDSTATTFAGILGYVEKNFGLKPLGVNDAAAYPFTHAFDYSHAPLEPIPMVNRPVPRGDHILWNQAKEDT
jgi:phospholipase C